MADFFRKMARRASEMAGAPWFFALNVLILAVWTLHGLIFGFSDTNVLIFTFVISVSTQLLVILIQNSQNGDTKAIQLKLDELLRAVEPARTEFIRLEGQPQGNIRLAEREMKALVEEFRAKGAKEASNDQ
jgi:low affinity Fe/Cu permease